MQASLKNIFESFRSFALTNKIPVYLINKPLSEKTIECESQTYVILLIPNHLITFINLSLLCADLNNVIDDIIENIAYFSIKYEYSNII